MPIRQDPEDNSESQVIRAGLSGEQCLAITIYRKTKGCYSLSIAYYHRNQSIHGGCLQPDYFELP